MSLTSYRAAPPRGVGCLVGPPDRVRGCNTVMSLTSPGLIRGSRAAPPRGMGLSGFGRRRDLAGVCWLRRLCGPGGDLLFRVLRGSTIGAEGFHGRVRDGIGCFAPRYGHQAGKGAARPAERARRWSSGVPGLDPGTSGRRGRAVRGPPAVWGAGGRCELGEGCLWRNAALAV